MPNSEQERQLAPLHFMQCGLLFSVCLGGLLVNNMLLSVLFNFLLLKWR